jgi:beta-glucosidase
VTGPAAARTSPEAVTPAIVQMWFPGHGLGASPADALAGAVNPSGKLPATFRRYESDPASAAYHPGHEGRAAYGERFSLGCRSRPGETVPASLFPFGHGLSYSRFSLGPPRVAARGRGHAVTHEITVPVTNCADPAGRENVQLYISSGHPDRPALGLKGFASTELGPGETSDAVITIPRRKLRAWTSNGRRPAGTAVHGPHRHLVRVATPPSGPARSLTHAPSR